MSNKLTRRIFLKTATGFGATLAAVTSFPAIVTSKTKKFAQPGGKLPVLVCSRGEEWGKKTNGPGWEVLSNGGSLLDAVEKAANVTELDPEDTSVGYGGLPNEDGVVQLDASCMYGPTYKAGCVAALEGIKTPSSIARLVMERTDHMMIVGAGAQRFAIMHGFQVENLLTEKARMIWLKWKENHSDEDDWIPPADGIYKDRTGRTYGTINVLGVDEKGNIAGITTTSGLSNKISGRVGDSPIIGAGLYVDNEVGAAGATGRGEEVIRTCGSFYIVSLMRQGMTPTQACVEACKRIIEINKKLGVPVDFYDKFVAVNKKGEVGCASIAYPKDRKHEVAFTNPDGFTAMAGELVKA
ncbi:N(4)-(beta-N-acetylglucosaminyl)-L-asparaginase [bacterium]|nr:N(4)-(beta-N-acetylglucosaminyl)-L-asparaginase [bacterium]NUM76737.1 N(4)-(beta-N-acetylglucosaminyl)-L-asparaginase [candidate division KSB1 bacterium]